MFPLSESFCCLIMLVCLCDRENNEKGLADIEKARLDALENAGDTEVMDALFARARLHAATGNCAAAFETYDEILAKEKTSTGKKIDATLEKARVAFFSLVSEKTGWLCHLFHHLCVI